MHGPCYASTMAQDVPSFITHLNDVAELLRPDATEGVLVA